MKKILLISTIALLGLNALAANNKQNHHCKLADGSMDMKKTHKECTKAKGKWVKDGATAPAAATPAKPAAAPAAH